MTDEEETGTPEMPEFVAVTPRGVVPEPPSAEVDLETEPAATDAPEAAPDAPEVAADGPEADSAPSDATSDAPEAGSAAPQPTPEAAPAPAVPALDDAAPAATPLTGPGAELPDPDSTPEAASDVEVSVRVAAEGMAAALAGHPTAAAEPGRDRERTLSPITLATAVCVVIAIAAGALFAVTAHLNSNRHAVAAARVAALAAAKRDAALVFTYSYQTLDQDIARAEAGMTAKFRAGYDNTMTTQAGPLARHNHSSTVATVAAAGVVSATANTVKVLVYLDQTVQNRLLSAVSRLDRSIIEVIMVKQGGHWLINDVQTF